MSKEKFVFKVPTGPTSTVLSLRMPVALYERLSKAAKSVSVYNGNVFEDVKTSDKRISKGCLQELTRQMIDHCLKDIGY
jgi:hypothetical protein